MLLCLLTCGWLRLLLHLLAGLLLRLLLRLLLCLLPRGWLGLLLHLRAGLLLRLLAGLLLGLLRCTRHRRRLPYLIPCLIARLIARLVLSLRKPGCRCHRNRGGEDLQKLLTAGHLILLAE